MAPARLIDAWLGIAVMVMDTASPSGSVGAVRPKGMPDKAVDGSKKVLELVSTGLLFAVGVFGDMGVIELLPLKNS